MRASIALVSRTWREESPAPSKVARDNRQGPSKYRSHSAELATAIGRRAGPSKRHRRSDDLAERAAVAFWVQNSDARPKQVCETADPLVPEVCDL